MLDVPKYLEANNVELLGTKTLRDGRTAYAIHCPFDESHAGWDCAIFQVETGPEAGKLGGKCLHDSCAENGWGQFRTKIGDPTADQAKPDPPGARRFGQAKQVDYDPTRDDFDLEVVTAAALMSEDLRQDYLVDGILTLGEPFIIGGAQKTLKTSIAIDLAASIASRTPFLGQFEVQEQRPTLLVSGESGKYVLRETMASILRAKQVEAGGLPLHFSFKIPRLHWEEHLDAIARDVEQYAIDLIMVDPAYLALLAAGKGSDAANLFSVGPLLLRFAEIGVEYHTTVCLVHHTKKVARGNENAKPGLADLSYSGFAEWARQWLLLGRREEYRGGSGQHRLWMHCGGSGGHGGDYALDVDVGKPDDDLIGRLWSTLVMDAGTLGAMQEGREEQELEQTADQLEQYLTARPNGVSKWDLRSEFGWGNKRAAKLLSMLLDRGSASAQTNGNRTRYFSCNGQT